MCHFRGHDEADCVGDSYDHTLAETIIGLYKTEVIRAWRPWKTMDDVEYATPGLGGLVQSSSVAGVDRPCATGGI